MKTKILISITILILISFLLIGGCATTSRITEPTSPDSALLIGRIKLTCTEFPKTWNINGDHPNGVVVYLANVSTKEIIKVRSRGSDGLFYLIDLDVDKYVIVAFSFQSGGSRHTVNLGFETKDVRYFEIKRNFVNNLGDIKWRSKYETKVGTEWSKAGSTTTFSVKDSYNYLGNYDEVKSWFEETYPESDWNNKNWINAR